MSHLRPLVAAASLLLGTALAGRASGAAPLECGSAWTVAPRPDTVLRFDGTADTAGHLFWTECATKNMAACEIVAAASSGQPMWRAPLHAGHGTLTVIGDLLLTWGSGTVVEARRVADGGVAWTRDLAADAARENKLRGSVVALTGFVRQGDAVLINARSGRPGATQSWLVALGRDGGRRWERVAEGFFELKGVDANAIVHGVWQPPSSGPGLPTPAYVQIDARGRDVRSIPRTAGQARDPSISLGMWSVLQDRHVVFDDRLAATIETTIPAIHCAGPCAPPAPILSLAFWAPDGSPLGSQSGLQPSEPLLLGEGRVLVVASGALWAATPHAVAELCRFPMPTSGFRSFTTVAKDVIVALEGNLGTSASTLHAYRLPPGVGLAQHGWVTTDRGSLGRDRAAR